MYEDNNEDIDFIDAFMNNNDYYQDDNYGESNYVKNTALFSARTSIS